MEEQVRTKKVFLTGGTSGIGRATALLLAKMGYRVFIVGRDSAKMHDVLRDAEQRGLERLITPIIHDLSRMQGTKELLDDIWQEHGPFEILVNNAGMGFGGVVGVEIREINHMIETNLVAYMHLSGFFAQRMKDNGLEGDILNIGSMSSDTRDAGSSGYVASKAGIQGFTEALRKEVNPYNIRVALIEPGSVSTDMQPQNPQEKSELQNKGEMLDSQDIADLIAYILQLDRRVSVAEVKIKPLKQLI